MKTSSNRPRSRSPSSSRNQRFRPRPQTRTFPSSSFLSFHIPQPTASTHSTNHLQYLKKEERQCIRSLSAYKPPKWSKIVREEIARSLAAASATSSPPATRARSREHVEGPSTSRLPLPLTRFAAVLVALFIGRHGDLYVLLSKRSESLRSYAGDTSLPGGKLELGDRGVEDAARREAFEEIGLSLDKTKVPLLCILEPFVAREHLIVTPVVVLVTDRTLRPILNQTEVSSLFSHPLSSFLSTSAPTPPKPRSGSLDVEVDEYADMLSLAVSKYYTWHDIPWMGRACVGVSYDRRRSGTRNGGKTVTDTEGKKNEEVKKTIRMHRFLTGREAGGVKPVYGLTAAILIRVASIGYCRAPEFDVEAPDQPSLEVRVRNVLERVRREVEEGKSEESPGAMRLKSRL